MENYNDKPNAGFAVLGFFFPLIGFILYLIWKNNFPQKARSCGKGALIGFISGIITAIVLNVLFMYYFYK